MNFFTTIGLHDGYLEMEILVNSSSKIKKEAEHIGKDNKFHIAYLYEDKLVIKGGILTIRKDQIKQYQFRVCREWKPMVSDEDYELISWDEAIRYIVEERDRFLPFTLESYYFRTVDYHPFEDTRIID